MSASLSLCFNGDDGLGQTDFSRVFLILSGSDTGIGHALAKYLDNLGFVVFAGVLNKDGPGAEDLRQTCSQRLSLLQLDVTNPTQVKEAYLQVSEKVQNTGTAFTLIYGGTNVPIYKTSLTCWPHSVLCMSVGSQGICFDGSCFCRHRKNSDDCSGRGYCVSIATDHLCFDLEAPSSSSL